MGTSFRWLLGSTWVSNIGDGIALAAGPLLVASGSSSPPTSPARWSSPCYPWRS